MRIRGTVAIFAPSLLVLACCAAIPDQPDDRTLPIQEILQRTACELRGALTELNDAGTQFNPNNWLINITLTPKIDTDLNAGLGITSKSTSLPSPRILSTATLGVSPAGNIDVKGSRSGAVTYAIKSADLIKKPLDCKNAAQTYQQLAKLGVGEWLRRTVHDARGAPAATIDKPTFSTDITIKFTGSGGYSYAFPFGSDALSLSGSYQIDEILGILMTPLAPPKKPYSVVTLPVGEDFATRTATVPRSSLVGGVEAAASRLDVIQLDQTIRNAKPLAGQ
jgi:hypothetical protein